MLERILTEFRKYTMPLTSEYLSKALQIEPSVLEGMLCMLERKGRIIEVPATSLGNENICHCHSCPLQHACPPNGTWYALVDYAHRGIGILPPDMSSTCSCSGSAVRE